MKQERGLGQVAREGGVPEGACSASPVGLQARGRPDPRR